MTDPSEITPGLASFPIADGDSLALDPQLESRRKFPTGTRFRDITLIGEGGMGRVYRAEDPLLGRTVALKITHDDSDLALMRFTGEAQAQARIDHPHVVKVFEVGEVQGTPFIVMQFVQGGDLGAVQDRLSLRQLARILQQVAEGVEAAHRLGLLHRDLKPPNILIEGADTDEPHPFVTDFGLVRNLDRQGLTATGAALGTPRYMSPEQAQGRYDQVDARSDVYSLGATMYEVFGGGPMYGELSDLPLFRKIMEEEPVPLRRKAPKVPEDLAVIVHTCLAKDPARRYPSAQALAEDLGRFLRGQPIWARRPSWGYRLHRHLAQHRTLVAVAALALLALLGSGGWFLASLARSQRQANLAAAFGQRAQKVENQLRLSYMSPEHSVRTQIEAMILEMDRLRTEVRQGGAAARGPGNWALGEGYLALGNVDEALKVLNEAWAQGFRTPESALARGRALLGKYLAGRNILNGIEDPKAKGEESARLEAQFKRPALEMLTQAQALPGGGPMLAAQLALLEGHEDEVLGEAAKALQAEPWHYEACLLQLQVWRDRHDRLQLAGDANGVARAQEQVEAAFRSALAIAPSCPEIWTQYGANHLDRDRLSGPSTIEEGTDAFTLQDQAIAAFDRALALDPKCSAALNNRSEIFIRRATIQHMKGIDPARSMDQAIADAERSLAVDPEQPRAHLSLARVLLMKANILVDAHRDATAELERGTAALQKARERVDQNGAYLGWAAYYSQEAQFGGLMGANAMNHGGDGRPKFRAACRAAERMREVDSASMNSIGMLGSILLLLADAEDRLGGDPMPVLEQAQAGFEGLLRRFPEHPQVLRDAAEVHRIRASQLARRGQDPGKELEEARRLVEKGLTRGAGFHELHQVKGRAGLAQARWERQQGRTGIAALTLAEAELRKAKALNPRIADLDTDLGEILAFRAGQPGTSGLR